MTFVKLPVAFSGGSRLKTEPVAGARLSTVPSKERPGNRVDRELEVWPGRISASWVSLKLASTWTPRAAPVRRGAGRRATHEPSSTARLPTMPSAGARTTVKERSRSALSRAVTRSARGARRLHGLRLEDVDVRLGRLEAGFGGGGDGRDGPVADGAGLIELRRRGDLGLDELLLAGAKSASATSWSARAAAIWALAWATDASAAACCLAMRAMAASWLAILFLADCTASS